MKKYILLNCIFITINLFGQNYNPAIQTWIINAETAPCNSTNGGECILYKAQGKKEFEILNEKIEDFNYEKGNTYTISVKQEIKQPPIAVGESVFKYVLVKVINKKPNTITPISSPNIFTTSSSKTIEVNYETVACEVDNSKSCLLIREKGKKEFEILNSTINGFDYQSGYSYVLNIVEDKSGSLFLLKEISKKFVQSNTTKYQPLSNNPTAIETTTTNNGKTIGKTNIQTSSSIDGKWYLRKMKDSENSSFVTDDNIIWIEIKTFNNSIKGFGACNNFEAVLRTDNVSTFQIDKLTSGYLNCGNKKLENLYYDLLQQADGFEIKNGNLILSKRWNYLLGFTNNPNNKEEINTTYTPPNIVKKENTTYATNQITNNNQDIYYPPVITSENTKTSTSSITTSNTDVQAKPITTTISPKEVNSSNDIEAEEMQRKIDELQKELAAKKQKAEDDARKDEATKLAVAKALEAKKQVDADKLQQQLTEKKKNEEELEKKRQSEIAQQKAIKQKEIDDLKRQLLEKEKEIEESSNTLKPNTLPAVAIEKQQEASSKSKQKNDKENKNTVTENIAKDNIKNNKTQQIIIQETSSVKVNKNTDFTTPQTNEFVYSVKDNKTSSLENSNAIFRGNEKSIYLELENSESTLQFIYNKLPKFIVKLNDNESPENSISLYSCDFKKEKRQIYVRPSKNKVLNSFSKVANNEYEIILPENLGEGEYVFVKQSDLNNQFQINATTIHVLSFGITYK